MRLLPSATSAPPSQPPLCAALRGACRAVPSFTTQCRRPADRAAVQRQFPRLYGAKFITLGEGSGSSAVKVGMGSGSGSDASVADRTGASGSGSGASSSVPPALTWTSTQTIGVLFCGRQSPGGHDVVCGMFDALTGASTLLGFVGGTKGLLANAAVPLTKDVIDAYRGQGGFDMLGRSTDNIRPDQFARVLAVAKARALRYGR